MPEQYAYSTDNPETVAVYRQAIADRIAMGKRLKEDAVALGAGPGAYLRSSGFGIDPDQITGLEQAGDHIPGGWRLVRGRLEPRRGKPGDTARRWLTERQPVDVRHVMQSHGLPRCAWKPREREFGWALCPPVLFEHEGMLWALYEAEPGTSESGFDEQRCTWTPRKLSEFYAAREAVEATRQAQAVA